MTPDTSVLVPALVRWHEHHAQAREAVERCSHLVAHVAVETYSVLTGLPGGRHLSGDDAEQLLVHHFPGEWLVLAQEHVPELLKQCARGGVRGGACYDALVGKTAAHHGHQLVTRDQRALPTYRAVGVELVTL